MIVGRHHPNRKLLIGRYVDQTPPHVELDGHGSIHRHGRILVYGPFTLESRFSTMGSTTMRCSPLPSHKGRSISPRRCVSFSPSFPSRNVKADAIARTHCSSVIRSTVNSEEVTVKRRKKRYVPWPRDMECADDQFEGEPVRGANAA